MTEEAFNESETLLALVGLVHDLQAHDYRDSVGRGAVQSMAFIHGKALVDLHASLQPRPWWRLS